MMAPRRWGEGRKSCRKGKRPWINPVDNLAQFLQANIYYSRTVILQTDSRFILHYTVDHRASLQKGINAMLGLCKPPSRRVLFHSCTHGIRVDQREFCTWLTKRDLYIVWLLRRYRLIWQTWLEPRLRTGVAAFEKFSSLICSRPVAATLKPYPLLSCESHCQSRRLATVHRSRWQVSLLYGFHCPIMCILASSVISLLWFFISFQIVV